MTILVYHGDTQSDSLAAYTSQVQKWRQQGLTVVALEGDRLEVAELDEALSQDDFFGGQRAVAITNLFARPKSKRRDALVARLATASLPIALWEGKKLTAATLKTLGHPQVYTSPAAGTVWALLAAFRPNLDPAPFIALYERTLRETSSQTDPGIYLLATFLWQIQQLIDLKQNNFRGAPFQKTRLQTQAAAFSLAELLDWHRRLILLDYQAKTGQINLPVSEQLLLTLLQS